MIIENIKVNGYKNLSNIDINLHPNLNIFLGNNAQGKTNLIELIWILSGCKSFRGTKEKDFININMDNLSCSLKFENSFREQEINFSMIKQSIKNKKITLNGVSIKTLSNLFSNLKCVIFTPEDLELSKGSPEKRRDFLDLCISQIKPSYYKIITKYNNILTQRNFLLKKISQKTSKIEELEVWDEQIARMGSYITVLRYNYIQKLNYYCNNLYTKISNNKENLQLKYSSSLFINLEGRTDYNGEMANEYLKKLKNNIKDDIKYGFTGIGIHRDDIILNINDLLVKDFGSQGQQRSVALVMKLAEAYILTEETNDSPVILLDDVLSELDYKRQQFILSSIKNMQVFITSCNEFKKSKINNGLCFNVENGHIENTIGE